MFVHVKVRTKQKKELFIQISELRFEASIKEEPKQNKANARIIEILKTHFNAGLVKIVSGHHHTCKLLSVQGINLPSETV